MPVSCVAHFTPQRVFTISTRASSYLTHSSRAQFIPPQLYGVGQVQCAIGIGSRLFSSSVICRAVKKQKLRTSTTPTKAVLKEVASFANVPTNSEKLLTLGHESYSTTLARKDKTTILYQAPSHRAYIGASYSLSAASFIYAGTSFYANYIQAPPDLATWVPYAFSAVSFGMAVFGTFVLLGASRIVQTITAIPTKLPQYKAAVGKASSPLQLEVVLRKMLPIPFFPARTLYVEPQKFILPMPLAPVEKRLTPQQERARAKEEAEEAHKYWEYEKSHVMSSPFRHLSQGLHSLFRSLGRTWNREGFLKVDINRQSYKLDVSSGWALDKGRALDRLVTVRRE